MLHEPHLIYEDDQFLVLDKPAGLVVHGDGRGYGASLGEGGEQKSGGQREETLSEWLVAAGKVPHGVGEPWVSQTGESIARPGIVHRLDKDTSGLLIVAKTHEMYAWLKEQFKIRTVHKEYEALVRGIIREESGVVDRPIGRSKGDFRKKSAQRGAQGQMRDAYTKYQVVQRYEEGDVSSELGQRFITHHPSLKSGSTLIRLFPTTGRMHQLRVHMKAIHHPIVGDPLYGATADKEAHARGETPLMLRAVSLTVPMPAWHGGGERVFCCKGLVL